jgi:hypothetical protein
LGATGQLKTTFSFVAFFRRVLNKADTRTDSKSRFGITILEGKT